MRATRALALPLLAVTLLVTACSDDDQSVDASSSGQEQADELDCGTFAMGHGPNAPQGFPEGRACIIDAFEVGTPARLKVDSLTIEGDLIHLTYDVVGRRDVEVTSDNREDAYRSQDLVVERCTVLRADEERIVHDGCRTVREVGRAESTTTSTTAADANAAARPGPAGRKYEVTATVLENRSHGPQLCLGAMTMQYPPSCGGPDVVGWSWDEVDDEQRAGDVAWGVFVLVGTYRDRSFTLTQPPRVHTQGSSSNAAVEPTTPCPPPPGGWAVADSSKLATLREAMANAEAQPDFAGAWVDQSINPDFADGIQSGDDMNNPAKSILNLRFTGDLERHQVEARELWGGPLCISHGRHTQAELLTIMDQLRDVKGMLGNSLDVIGNRVRLQVIVDEGLQAQMDGRYGPGTVLVEPELLPVD